MFDYGDNSSWALVYNLYADRLLQTNLVDETVSCDAILASTEVNHFLPPVVFESEQLLRESHQLRFTYVEGLCPVHVFH